MMSHPVYATDLHGHSESSSFYDQSTSLPPTTYPSPPPISAVPFTRSPSLTSSSSLTHSTSSGSGLSPIPAPTPLPYSAYELERPHMMSHGYPQEVQIADSEQNYRFYGPPHGDNEQNYRFYGSPQEMCPDNSGPLLDRYTRHSDLNPYYTTSPLIPPRSLTHPSLSHYAYARAPHPYRMVPSHTMQVPSQAYPVVYTDNASVKLTDRIRRKCHNCESTATSTWRRSSLSPGKVLCNKCGLFERTHSVARPRNKLPKGALSGAR